MIDIIAESGVKKLVFAGGEPLLVPHVIDLIKYAHEKGLDTALYTTDIGLTDGMIERLDSGILTHLAIPLEGSTPEIHQKTMGKNIPKHFDVVIRLLPKLVNRNFNLEVSTVVNRQNIEDLNNLGNLLRQNKVPKWKLFQFYPLGRGLLYRKDFEISEEEFRLAAQGHLDRFIDMDIDVQVGDPEKQASYFNLGPSGEVYTAFGDQYAYMGNIFEKSPLEIWQDTRFNHERHSSRHWRDIIMRHEETKVSL